MAVVSQQLKFSKFTLNNLALFTQNSSGVRVVNSTLQETSKPCAKQIVGQAK